MKSVILENTKKLWNSFFTINKIDKNCLSDLDKQFCLACIDGNLEKIKELEKLGISISYKAETALINACYHSHFDLLIYCLESGANIHANNDEALKYAVHKKNLKIIENVYDYYKNKEVAYNIILVANKLANISSSKEDKAVVEHMTKYHFFHTLQNNLNTNEINKVKKAKI